MSRVYHAQNPQHLFQNRAEIETHLLAKTQSNQGGKTGTELELFVTTPEGRPPSFDQVEMIYEHMAAQFRGATTSLEKGRIVGINLPGVGDVSLEPGGQIEISTKPCKDMAELADCNKYLRDLLNDTAATFGLVVEGAGHKPAFLQAEDMPRSRFHAYYAYCREQYGAKAEDLINTMKSCCGLQVNVDPMGERFHEIYRALMLVDVAESFAGRTTRQQRLHDSYLKLAPEQMTPVFETLSAQSNEAVVGHIVDRLLTLKIPFVPDAEAAEGFRSTKDVFGKTPTVGELLNTGKLTTEILDNALSLQLTMPNMRRHGVLETRAPDSMDGQAELLATTARYHAFTYDAAARQGLLKQFENVDADALKIAFLSRFDLDTKTLMAFDIGGGKTVSDLVQAVRGEEPVPHAIAAAKRQPRSRPQPGA